MWSQILLAGPQFPVAGSGFDVLGSSRLCHEALADVMNPIPREPQTLKARARMQKDRDGTSLASRAGVAFFVIDQETHQPRTDSRCDYRNFFAFAPLGHRGPTNFKHLVTKYFNALSQGANTYVVIHLVAYGLGCGVHRSRAHAAKTKS